MDIITRKEAKEKGLKRYFLGTKCTLGGIGERLTSSSGCLCEIHKAKAAKYVRDKCDRDPEYRQRRVDIVKKYRHDNKEQCVISGKRFYDKEEQTVRNKRSRTWYNNKSEPERLKYSKHKYYKNLQRSLFNSAKQRAKRLKVLFDLTLDDIIIPEVCPVFGQPFKWGIEFGKNDYSPSLDRIIPEKGYVKGNVVVISWLANRLKSDATLEQLKQICTYYESNTISCCPINAASGSENVANAGVDLLPIDMS